MYLRGGLFELPKRGKYSFFKPTLSKKDGIIFRKQLRCKVEKLKHMTWEVLQPKTKKKSELPAHE